MNFMVKLWLNKIDSINIWKDFNYFKLDFDDSLIKEFEKMQDKYVLNDKYKFSIDQVKKVLEEIHRKM